MPPMPLTEVKAKQAQPGEKDVKLSDEKGMYLVYPQVTLKLARAGRDKARLSLSEGVDPSQLRQTKKLALQESQSNSFQAIAEEWFTITKTKWTDSTVGKQSWILEKNLFPWIGSVRIDELDPPQILKALRRIESRGAMETAHRAKQVVGQVCRYAVSTGELAAIPAGI